MQKVFGLVWLHCTALHLFYRILMNSGEREGRGVMIFQVVDNKFDEVSWNQALISTLIN